MSIRQFLLLHCVMLASAPALTIQIDYRYDTNQFFSAAGNPGGATGAAQARAALQAAADRWGEIINQPLTAVNVRDDATDVRIGFNHPGTGASFQVSSAASAATDALAQFDPADDYWGNIAIPADTAILFAGGRNISSAGIGGTGTGLNYTSVFEDPLGVHNRGFNVGCDGCRPLPVWGGAITFSNSSTRNWHFDHTTGSGPGESDFYSIALHEIGHVLGLSTDWDDWSSKVSEGYFAGAAAIAAYNSDNGTQLSQLLLQMNGSHWSDGSYDSVIFSAGSPNYVGTVGAGEPQDLLMEPTANFSYPSLRRFEVTNVDVGGLRDIGWSTIAAGAEMELEISSMTIDAAGMVVITWSSDPGEDYTVETSSDMRVWSAVTPDVRSAGTTTTWTDGAAGFNDPNAPSSRSAFKFYRIRQK